MVHDEEERRQRKVGRGRGRGKEPTPIFPKPHHFPSRSRKLHFPTLSSKTNTISLPPTKPLNSQSQLHPPPNPHHEFEKKMLYLDSIGLDFLSLITEHPPILSASLSDIKSTVDFVTSMGFTAPEFRRICGMCPQLLTSQVSEIVPVFTFLLREAGVEGANIRRVINRRPRLLVSSVENRLRPTLYFLQSIGISKVNRHTHLLSSSVEEKLIPRIDYLEKIGFSHREALAMARRFPLCSVTVSKSVTRDDATMIFISFSPVFYCIKTLHSTVADFYLPPNNNHNHILFSFTSDYDDDDTKSQEDKSATTVKPAKHKSVCAFDAKEIHPTKLCILVNGQ